MDNVMLNVPSSFFVLILFIFFLYHFIVRPIISKEKQHTDPPRAGGAWPIIGHMPLLGVEKLAHVILGSMADKYGPVFAVKLGTKTALVINNCEMAKECFTTHDKNFSNRPKIAASMLLGYNYAMFGFAPYSPYWSKIKKIATTELLSNHKLQMLKYIRVNEVKLWIGELYKTWVTSAPGEEDGRYVAIDLKPKLNSLLMNITLRMVAGKRNFGADTGEEAARFREALREFSVLFGAFCLSDAIPSLGWYDFKGHKREMKRTAKKLDVLMSKWLEEHKTKKRMMSEDEIKDDEGDFMDAMLNVLEEDAEIAGFQADTIVKATSLNLIFGGTDTTMVSLIWAISLLLNNPKVMKKAQDELQTYVGENRQVDESDIRNLVYLQAIVKETLRLYPPAPLLGPRESMEDCSLSGYRIPAGTRLIVNLWKIHRDEQVWFDPNEFRPERFIENHVHMDENKNDFEPMPFGLGRRSCPGASMALQIVHLALASLLHSFELVQVSGENVDMTESAGLGNVKATPLEALLRPSLSSHHYAH